MKIFGFEINKEKKQEDNKNLASFTFPQNDGSFILNTSHNAVREIAFDQIAKSEYDLINFYRYMSTQPIVNDSIEEIVNEVIVNDEKNVCVQINLDNIKTSEKIKDSIRNDFEHILNLLDFNTNGYDIFRKWYIDSRIVYQKVIDTEKPEQGILELKEIDSRKIIRIKEFELVKQNDIQYPKFKEEYFLFYDSPINYDQSTNFGFSSTYHAYQNLLQQTNQQNIKISKEALAYIDSGLVDPSSNIIYGFLHKCIKPFNQLNMLEDSAVIYRIVRAPERRVFYIDTGSMSPKKIPEYISGVINTFKNKLVYNPSTGDIKDDKKYLAMQEDIFLPRMEGGKGTEVSTLASGANLGEMDDILYFENKLKKATNVPLSRFSSESPNIVLGNQTEISRDEMKFSKYISRLRAKFSEIFYDILKTQLVLKNVITEEDWDVIKNDIRFDFLQDSYFSEVRESELLKSRIETANFVKDYEGIYYSRDHIRRNILKQTDDEIKNIDEQIKEEQANGEIPSKENLLDKQEDDFYSLDKFKDEVNSEQDNEFVEIGDKNDN